MTADKLVTIFLDWAKKNRAKRTVDFYRMYLERFLKSVGKIFAADLRAHHLLTFSSAWHPMQAVQRCFAWCCDEAELIDRNPFKKLKRPRLGQRSRILTPQESARLLRGSGTVFRAFLLAMRESIARPQEVREFTWEQIQVHGQPAQLQAALVAGRAAFHLAQFKGNERRRERAAARIVPITARLGRCLERLARGRDHLTGLIFVNSQGQPWTRNALRLRMGAMRAKIGLVPDARGERVVCYTLRHTSATEASALGVRDRILADLMGHTNPRMTARYQHLQPEHLINASADLAARRKNPPPSIL